MKKQLRKIITLPKFLINKIYFTNWKNKFSEDRCIIMGNGPSLNKMDLSLFQDEYVWGSNRCYLLYPRINWRPKFYVAVDTRVTPDIKDDLNKLINTDLDTSFFFPSKFRESKILHSNKNVYWYKEVPQSREDLPYSYFSMNPAKFLYSVNTVTAAALQLAVYMGFNPIYLIGCDTSYAVKKSVKFENGNKDLLISSDDDNNHFDPSYFGEGKKWHAPKVENMIHNYEQVKAVCDEIGVEVFNATVGGNLEVFPRVNYLDLFD
ncbi:MAG: DUF115 domain-containing protein [Anaerolineaceae bacterium]|nr:DUF115 domain-containing protein [Anaerolineaceae bacterium]